MNKMLVLSSTRRRARFIADEQLQIDPDVHARSSVNPKTLSTLSNDSVVVVSDLWEWPSYAQANLMKFAERGGTILTVAEARNMLG